MSTEGLWQRVRPLLEEAWDWPVEERAARLRESGAEPSVIAEVSALLAADAQVGDGFLAGSASTLASSWLAGGSLESGAVVGPFRLISLLGRGGMGEVFRAERVDGQFAQVVALKLVRGFASPELRSRFLLERRVLARLEHPGIARLLDGGVAEDGAFAGRPWFAMELVEGSSLVTHCEERELGIGSRLELFLQVCEAVQFAHTNLIIHRDLKPGNVMVTEEERVRLLDFGIAKVLEEDEAEETRTALLAMTPEYAAPEQVRGDAATTATDVYALGLVLHELLCGERAQKIESHAPAAVAQIVCNRELPSPSAVLAARRDPEARRRSRQVRGDLDAIVAMAVRKEATRRYPSAGALADDLRRFLEERPVSAQPDSLAYRSARFVRRYRWPLAVVSIALFALVALAIVSTFSALRVRDALVVAEVEAETSEQIASFLRGLFIAATPEEQRGTEISVREVLDRGARRITIELADQPAVQSTLLGEIGRIYSRLDLDEEARLHLEEAIRLHRSGLEKETVELGTHLHWLSLVYDDLGDIERSEELAREALALRQELAAEAEAIGQSLDRLGSVVAFRGDLEEGVRLGRDAVALLEREVGQQDERTQTAMHNLAWALGRQGRFDEEEQLLRRVLDVARAELGADHPDVLVTTDNLAVNLRRQGKLDLAEALYREVLGVRRKVLGDEHSDLGFTLNNLARVLVERGALDEARELYEEAREIWRRRFGDEHRYVGVASANLAKVMERQGELVGAEALLRRAIAILERAHLGSAQHLVAMADLAGILERAGRLGEALIWREQAVDVLVQERAVDDLDLARARGELGRTYLALGRSGEAVLQLEAALQELLKALPSEDPEVAALRRALRDAHDQPASTPS